MLHKRPYLGPGLLAIGALLGLLVGSRMNLAWLPLSVSVRLDTTSLTTTRVVTSETGQYDLELTVGSSPGFECFLGIDLGGGEVRTCSHPPPLLYAWWQVRHSDTVVLQDSTHSRPLPTPC